MFTLEINIIDGFSLLNKRIKFGYVKEEINLNMRTVNYFVFMFLDINMHIQIISRG